MVTDVRDFYFEHAPKLREKPDEKWVSSVIKTIQDIIEPEKSWREIGYRFDFKNYFADLVFKKDNKYVLVEVQTQALKEKMYSFMDKDLVLVY